MSKRNFILLIIILALAVIAVFGFLYFRGGGTAPGGEESTGTNFLSQFNPFRSNTPTREVGTPGVDTGEDQPSTSEEIPAVKLKKISSMPIAGFAVFMKERLKEVPIVVPATAPSMPYSFGSATLKNGSTGEGVMEIQRFLNNTLNLSLELDGVLDAEIITAIKQWQSANGLVSDGIVGVKTKAIMYSSVNQETKTTKPTPPPTEFMVATRYVERATGNIYQTFADKIEERKFSTTVIPKIYEAYFGSNGQSVIMRHLKTNERTIETFVGTLPKEKIGEDMASNEIKGSFLVDDIKDMSVSPDTLKIFYLFSSAGNLGNSLVGTIFNLLDSKKTQVFDSAFTEWLSFWPNNKIITLTTKPSGIFPGHMYMVNLDNKNVTRVLGDINGLTTVMSPNGKLVLYGNNNLSLYIYHTDTKVSEVLGVRTLPEKCVWGKTSEFIYCAVPASTEVALYPDDWYRGEISFSDQVWKINIQDGNATMIVDPLVSTVGEDIDGIKLALDRDENYLFLVNKKDSFLWELELK